MVKGLDCHWLNTQNKPHIHFYWWINNFLSTVCVHLCIFSINHRLVLCLWYKLRTQLLWNFIMSLFHFTFTLFNFLVRWLHTNNNFLPTNNNFSLKSITNFCECKPSRTSNYVRRPASYRRQSDTEALAWLRLESKRRRLSYPRSSLSRTHSVTNRQIDNEDLSYLLVQNTRIPINLSNFVRKWIWLLSTWWRCIERQS